MNIQIRPNRHFCRLRAFSLPELMIAVGILLMVSTVGYLSLRSSTRNVTSDGLAETLATALREARMKAISSGSPVALCFPSGGGATPLASSFYTLDGPNLCHLLSSQRWDGDFPNCYAFNGLWPTDASQFRNPGVGGQVNPSPPGSPWNNYQNVASLLPATSSGDYCYLFRPDGSVSTNGLQTFDGAYHLLTSAGVGTWSNLAGPPPGALPVFAPTLIGNPYTITIALDGSVTLTRGIVAVRAGAVATGEISSGPLTNAPLPPPFTTGAVAPNLISLDLLSQNNLPTGPGLPDITVGIDGFVSLDAVANDTNLSGKRLFAVWTVSPNSANGGNGPSNYSVPLTTTGEPLAMDWSASANGGSGAWVSRLDWRPPANAVPGDLFTLSLVVQDSLGVSRTATVNKVASICPPGKILADDNTVTSARHNPDGSAATKTLIGATPPLAAVWQSVSTWLDDHLSASADGQRIAFRTNRLIAGVGRNTAVADGYFQNAFLLTNSWVPIQGNQAISPAGDMVAYVELAGPIPGVGTLVVQEAGGLCRRLVVDTDLGFYSNPALPPGNEAFVGMESKNFFDRITWDPSGGAGGTWTIYYSAFGSAATDTPGTTQPSPNPVIRKAVIKAADSGSGPTLVTAPSSVPQLIGCFSPSIPGYDTAPSEMVLVRWNGGVSANKTITIWDLNNPAAGLHDQPLPSGWYGDPVFVSKGTVGQDSIVCTWIAGYTYGGYAYWGAGNNPVLARFTPNISGAAIADFLTLVGAPTNPTMPFYTSNSW